MDKPTVRIFISSPADVRPERLLAERIVARLDREFGYHFHVEAVLWEREPLVAAHHFQDPRNIPRPSSADIVVVILWARLGVPLPEDEFRGAISGRPVTGTEWEFEDALAAAREHDGIPELLVYQKRATVAGSLEDDAAIDAFRQQRKMLQDFIGRWFGSAENNDIRAASHTFGTAQEFEDRLYEHLSALLERKAGSVGERAAIRWHDAPFRGLASFDLEHAPIFFGRTRARNEVREALARRVAANERAFIMVFGASGSGKSSLVKAGVLADLMLPGMIGRVGLCRYAVLRPSDGGGDAVTALAAALLSPTALPELGELQYRVGDLAALLRRAPEQVVVPIRQGLAAAGKSFGLTEQGEARLVLVCDQLEELFAEGVPDERRREFVAALDALAASGLVWVIATMRSDFFSRLEWLPALLQLAGGDARYVLAAPTAAELGEMIRRPALEAGLSFEVDPVESRSLDELIRETAATDRAVLPLLSFLLDQLWQRRDEHGMLTFAAYHELGGLEGALAQHANRVYEALPPDVRAALPRVLRAMVRLRSDDDAPTALPIPLGAFAPGTPERRLIDAFMAPEARLFVGSDDSIGSEPRVRVVHEALLTHWGVAREQIAADRADLALRARLNEAAARWEAADAADRPALLLSAGRPLNEASELVGRQGAELDARVREYVAASKAFRSLESGESRQRSVFGWILSLFLAASFLFLALFVWAADGFGSGFDGWLALYVTGCIAGAIGSLLPGRPRTSMIAVTVALLMEALGSGAVWYTYELTDRYLGWRGAPDMVFWYFLSAVQVVAAFGVATLRGWWRSVAPRWRFAIVTTVAIAVGTTVLQQGWVVRTLPEDITLPTERRPAGIALGSNGDPLAIVSLPDSDFVPDGVDSLLVDREQWRETQLPLVGGITSLVQDADENLWLGTTGAIIDVPPSELANATLFLRKLNGAAYRRFPVRTGGVVTSLVVGPDGAVWGTVQSAGHGWIVRVSRVGETREFAVPTPNGSPESIVVGPDGALWFGEAGVGKIGRMTTAGAIEEITVPGATGVAGVATGKDGAVWFTQPAEGRVGRITPERVIQEFPVPTKAGVRDGPNHIVAAGDGAIWFTYLVPAVGRIDSAGHTRVTLLNEYSGKLTGIVAGRDGSIWVSQYGDAEHERGDPELNGAVARIRE